MKSPDTGIPSNTKTEMIALLNARLARILRWSDWDAKNKQPILWRPPA